MLKSILCGNILVTLCFHKLWAYSAIGRSVAQLVCLSVIQSLRYCSTHMFIHSIYLLVYG